jgi:NADH:ubiquinone oxidoreductase subunit H
MIKEDIVPAKSDRLIFALAPAITLAPAIIAFAVIPFSGTPAPLTIFGHTWSITPWVTDINVALLYLLAVSSIGVFGIVLGGWASNSKYPLLGALRSAAQMVSYEVPLGLSVVGVLILAGTASLTGSCGRRRARGSGSSVRRSSASSSTSSRASRRPTAPRSTWPRRRRSSSRASTPSTAG